VIAGPQHSTSFAEAAIAHPANMSSAIAFKPANGVIVVGEK
jgi:hypothetical protein